MSDTPTFNSPFAALPKDRFAKDSPDKDRSAKERLAKTREAAPRAPKPASAQARAKAAATQSADDAEGEALFLATVAGQKPAVSVDADAHDFTQAVQDVQPLQGKGRAVAPAPTPQPSVQAYADATMQDVLDGKLEFALSLSGEYLEGHVLGLDMVTMNKLRAGRYSPEAHLDLHGLNAAQAFQALVGFFRGAWYKGMRSVLLVPGRGRNSADGMGVLRSKLQEWLTREPLKRVVLAFCTARPADGGPGSVYVLLRKYRKKGKICWERMPPDPDLY